MRPVPPSNLGFIFDLDGTLVDSRADITACANHALQALGYPTRDEEEIARMVGDGARSLIARAADLNEDDPGIEPLLAAFLAHYEAHPADLARWLPGAMEVLDKLQGHPLALCTNKPRSVTLGLLEAMAMREHFSVVVAGGDLPEKKPSPAPILACARALSLPPSSLIVVGDGPQDVLAGKRAGCTTVAILGGFGERAALEAAGPDALLSSLYEIAGWVEARRFLFLLDEAAGEVDEQREEGTDARKKAAALEDRHILRDGA